MSCFHYLITDVPSIFQPLTQDLMKTVCKFNSELQTWSFLFPLYTDEFSISISKGKFGFNNAISNTSGLRNEKRLEFPLLRGCLSKNRPLILLRKFDFSHKLGF